MGHESMKSVLSLPTDVPARRSRASRGRSGLGTGQQSGAAHGDTRLMPASSYPHAGTGHVTPSPGSPAQEDVPSSPDDASDEIMDRLVKSVTQSANPRPCANKERRRSRGNRKSRESLLSLSPRLVPPLCPCRPVLSPLCPHALSLYSPNPVSQPRCSFPSVHLHPHAPSHLCPLALSPYSFPSVSPSHLSVPGPVLCPCTLPCPCPCPDALSHLRIPVPMSASRALPLSLYLVSSLGPSSLSPLYPVLCLRPCPLAALCSVPLLSPCPVPVLFPILVSHSHLCFPVLTPPHTLSLSPCPASIPTDCSGAHTAPATGHRTYPGTQACHQDPSSPTPGPPPQHTGPQQPLSSPRSATDAEERAERGLGAGAGPGAGAGHGGVT